MLESQKTYAAVFFICIRRQREGQSIKKILGLIASMSNHLSLDRVTIFEAKMSRKSFYSDFSRRNQILFLAFSL
jgi:hypothetical protein